MDDRPTIASVAQMTWFTYRNYGTVLQAYALHDAIGRLGYKVSMLNYDPALGQDLSAKRSWRRVGALRFARAAKHAVLGDLPLIDATREHLFDVFIADMLNVTTPLLFDGSVNERELISSFDAFVCGSDQIWSPRFYDPHYFLDFVEDCHRKVAYAPSFGSDLIQSPDVSGKIAGHLTTFDSISVRETSGVDLVRRLVGEEATIVVDPTLLLEEQDWSALCSYSAVPDGPYCLVYFLGNSRESWTAAEKISRQAGLPIIAIPVFERDRKRRVCLRKPVGPREFLGLFKRADCVCTDSFHGMIFSILFGIPLHAFERFSTKDPASQNTRVYSFLDMIEARGLLVSRRKLKSRRELPAATTDYSRSRSLIGISRESSLSFLSRTLSTATSHRVEKGII